MVQAVLPERTLYCARVANVCAQFRSTEICGGGAGLSLTKSAAVSTRALIIAPMMAASKFSWPWTLSACHAEGAHGSSPVNQCTRV
jgi:hypothetical protein